jgi:parvulin-like peptidyl-prolyl isomerase
VKRFLREPLLHFALLGALLFAAYAFLNREPAPGPQRIVVSLGRIEHLFTTFARTWQRPPSGAEMKALVDQYVREEVLSREALKLGLEQNDTVIRRRLQQKMEFIAEDLVAIADPREADLAAYLAKYPDAFRQDQQLTFRHVYLNPEKRGDQLDADVAKLLADLQTAGAQADISTLGDPTLLERAFRNESQRRVEADFGAEFSTTLASLPLGEWTGPVRSGFGTHLVLVEQRTEGRIATLDEVRPQVRREWENARRLETNTKFLETLLEQYEVTIEWPKEQAASITAQR